ncbi:MAG TPA: GGDEF domain-containing protein [Gemmatimonadales bacterium]|nr:GGDEF domain-containing protein [Gemmatimonadales bacterium]
MPDRSSAALRALLPEAAIVAAAVTATRVPAAHPTLAGVAPVFALAVLATGLLLAWRFHRSRLAFALVLLLLSWLALPPLHPTSAARALGDAVATLLPLNLLALGLVSERGVFSPAGLRGWAVIGLQVAVLVLGANYAPFALGRAARLDLLSAGIASAVGLPAPAILASILALALLATLWIRDPRSPGRNLFWVTVAALAGLTHRHAGAETEFSFATGGLLLVLGVVEASYHLAYHDALTDLPGRRALEEALLRLGDRYAVAMVDVDHFKQFNDRYGHDAGDQVLRMVAARLEAVAGGGTAYRYGGEEFAVLFPGQSADDAAEAIDAVRRAIEGSSFTIRSRLRPRRKPAEPHARRSATRATVTVSAGVAERGGRAGSPRQVVDAADRALYAAKAAGRNRVSR